LRPYDLDDSITGTGSQVHPDEAVARFVAAASR
jgi:hypothetical protein